MNGPVCEDGELSKRLCVLHTPYTMSIFGDDAWDEMGNAGVDDKADSEPNDRDKVTCPYL